ncbi:homoserine kinase [Paenibacillus taichungensis]|uniref:Homoserine kinase n=1 Tax=Paenibacillus taichungensis TaxID=484184 RepID=A0ABX2MJ77_9BACL|nr:MULTISPECIES: homoserine kinase [Paenibacillus]NUU53742.1 homoserine kinase [Paenibacillus taichungensis]PIH57705.1 homoserine kinase [Paenibacillus sp. LK1]
MSLKQRVTVKVPASTANLGPGFDTLGMALSLYAWLEMKPAEQTTFHLHGDHLTGLPTDKSNLLYEVAQMVFNEAGISVPELEISMYSDIPLTRGLGSSASAIVGALAAANALIGTPLSDAKLLDMATSLEKHPDNVGASLYGGIITAAWDGSRVDHIIIEPHQDLQTLVIVPDFELSTSKARNVIPQQFDKSDVIHNISRSSLLVAALASGRLDMIQKAMSDRIHQPYRASLVPGMAEILENAVSHGALGAALSGAGPTVLTLVDRHDTRKLELEQYLIDTMSREGITASALWLDPDLDGVTVLPDQDESPFMDRVKGEVNA